MMRMLIPKLSFLAKMILLKPPEMQKFKDKMKEIERQEELIQRKKLMLDQKLLGQKLLEQQKAITSSSDDQSSKKNHSLPGHLEPANRGHSVSDKSNGKAALARLNAFTDDGSFLQAFQLLRKTQGDVSAVPEPNQVTNEISAKDEEYDEDYEADQYQSEQYQQHLPFPPPSAPSFRHNHPPYNVQPGQPPFMGPHHPHPNHYGQPMPPQNGWQMMPPGCMPPHGPFPPMHPMSMQRFPQPGMMLGSIPGLPLPPPPPPPPPMPECSTNLKTEDDEEAYDPFQPTEDIDFEDDAKPDQSEIKEESQTFSEASDLRKSRKSRWGERSEDEPSTVEDVADEFVPYFMAPDIDQLKQLREQHQLKAMEDYIRARQNAQRAAMTIKSGQVNSGPVAKKPNKYQYDSDEEIDEHSGTWEHQMRKTEMEATRDWAQSLDEMSTEKHHIGDFLPPEELVKFMETFQALKDGRTPQISDYEKFKLTCENVGFQMLKKMGWKEGEGIGKDGQGIVDPVGRGLGFLGDGSSSSSAPVPTMPNKPPIDALGQTGATAALPNNFNLSSEDDEFDAYRKRMMLSYRFRPNPLNNPRRPYY